MSLGSYILNTPFRNFRQIAQINHVNANEHKRKFEEIKILDFPFLQPLGIEYFLYIIHRQTAFLGRSGTYLEAPKQIMRCQLVVNGRINDSPDIAKMDVEGVLRWRGL